MNKLPNQFKKCYRASTKAGWRWEMRTNHVEVRDANGDFVVSISTTMYDGPLSKRIFSNLRRANCPGV